MQKLDDVLFAIDYLTCVCDLEVSAGELAIIYSVLPELIHGVIDGNLTVNVAGLE